MTSAGGINKTLAIAGGYRQRCSLSIHDQRWNVDLQCRSTTPRLVSCWTKVRWDVVTRLRMINSHILNLPQSVSEMTTTRGCDGIRLSIVRMAQGRLRCKISQAVQLQLPPLKLSDKCARVPTLARGRRGAASDCWPFYSAKLSHDWQNGHWARHGYRAPERCQTRCPPGSSSQLLRDSNWSKQLLLFS